MTRGAARGLALALAAAALSPAAAQGLRARHRPPDASPVAAAPGTPFPFGVTWTLESIDGKPVLSADPPSFAIDQTLRASGFAGCNTFSMPLYPVKNQTLAAGAIATTRKACAPDVMARERAMLVALHALPHWAVTPDGDLVVKAPGATLRFRRGL